MQESIDELNGTLLEVYDQMVMLEKLLRDLTMVLKQNGVEHEELTRAINNIVGMIV